MLFAFIKRLQIIYFASILPQMASTTPTTSHNSKEIVAEIPPYIRIFNDGTVERTAESTYEPPILDDPQNGISSKDIAITENPPVSARIYLPKLTKSSDQEKFPIFVYFHGGGFFMGSVFSKHFHTLYNHLVPQTNAIAVSVEYRLAPENPLPACYHDCWEALKWVTSHSHKDTTNNTNKSPWLIDHGDFNRIFIGGDSAGGNITHNIAMRAGSEALPCDVKLLGAILCHPYFYSSKPIGSEPVTEAEKDLCQLMWKLVYPCAPGGIDNPMVNPVGPGAPSLATIGCHKIFLCTAGKDPLRDRAFWYYEALKNSGWKGEIEFFEEKEEGHAYHTFHPETENSYKLFKLWASFLHH